MQDIISTLKNALQQAEAGLEVAVGRLDNDGTERGDFKPSEVLALAIVREALATPATCLHQIQEPAAAEQAAWHSGLDEGRAQAAPSVMAVPDGWKLVPVKPTKEMLLAAGFSASAHGQSTTGLEKWEAFLNNAPTPPSQARAALAATPAAEVAAPVLVDDMKQELMALYNEIMKQGRGMHYWNYAAAVLARYRGTLATPLAAAPVVLPEPDFHVRPASAVQPHRALMIWDNDATSEPAYFARTVRALLATATGLPAQAEDIADLVTGMSVSVDVSTGDDDAGNRYFGTVTLAQEDNEGKHGLTLLVQDAEPNFTPQAQADARDADVMYYLQDARWSAMVGNCPSFWRSGGGYTTSLDDAERFTLEAAMKQHKCRETDLPWLCSELDKLRRPTVDCQYMPRSWDAQRAAIAAQAAQGGE